MELFLNSVLALIILIIGIVSIRYNYPQPPFLKYKNDHSRGDFIITVLSGWLMYVLSSMLHTHALSYSMSSESISFFSKFGTFVAVHLYLKYILIRPSHVGLYTLPTAMNIIATVVQIEALKESSMLWLALAKMSRLFFVAVVLSDQPGLWAFVTVMALIFVLLYDPEVLHLPSYAGLVWLCLFVFSDIMTSISQEKIFVRFQVTPGVMMYYINGILSAVYFINIIFEDKSQIYKNYSEHAILLIAYSLLSAGFQYFHLKIIKIYGAVMFTFVCICKYILLLSIGKMQFGSGLNVYDYFILTWMFLLIIYCPVENRSRSISISLPHSTEEVN